MIINIISFIFMMPLGISYSASALTGNYIGEGKIDLAKKFAMMTLFFDMVLTTVIIIILGSCKEAISQLFTQEPNVTRIFFDSMWVLLIYIWFDTIHGVQSGIIRGLGRQVYGSVYTLFCYYILGMPLALMFCFKKDMGIAGLWLGFTIACVILDIGFAMIISCPNWQKISEAARNSIKEKGQMGMTPEVRSVKKILTPKVDNDSKEGGFLIRSGNLHGRYSVHSDKIGSIHDVEHQRDILIVKDSIKINKN